VRAWTTEDVVFSKKVQAIKNLDYEVSLAIYVRPDALIASSGVDHVGTAYGVQLPDLPTIQYGCITHGTNQIILVHNHPYIKGVCDASPSKLDLKATRKFIKQLRAVGIMLLDHIIIGQDGTYYSFKNAGFM
jgi:hypothetical protein